jgi:hypothetical protein
MYQLIGVAVSSWRHDIESGWYLLGWGQTTGTREEERLGTHKCELSCQSGNQTEHIRSTAVPDKRVAIWRMPSPWLLRRVALVNLVFLSSVRQLLVTSNVVPSMLILVALMKVVMHSSETSVLTRATRRKITEDDILHSHCRENHKSYTVLSGWAL